MKLIKKLISEVDRKLFKGFIYLFLKTRSFKKTTHILKVNKKPLIICGCGRLGTTLLLSMLSSIPNIYAIPKETGAFCKSSYQDKPLQKEKMRILDIYKWLLNYDNIYNKTRWCEKTPKNVQRIGEILDYFNKKVKIIHIVRDGRDVITSINPIKKEAFWISPERWISDVQAGLKYENHPNVLTIRYEDLINNQKETLIQVCEFIGEQYTFHVDEYPDHAEIQVSRAWFKQASSLHSRSIGRWREEKYVKRIDEFVNNPESNLLLKHFNYL